MFCRPRGGSVLSDADIVLRDPSMSKTIRAANQVSRIDYNVFEGFDCMGANLSVVNGKKRPRRMGWSIQQSWTFFMLVQARDKRRVRIADRP